MDEKFFWTFVGITLILEIIPIRMVMQKANEYRHTDFSDIDDVVTATLKKSGSYKGDQRWVDWAKYEWTYNGRKRHVTFYDNNATISPLEINAAHWDPPSGSYPYETKITVNRKTGKFKVKEGERRVQKMNVGLVLFAFVAAYIITSIIYGYCPLLS